MKPTAAWKAKGTIHVNPPVPDNWQRPTDTHENLAACGSLTLHQLPGGATHLCLLSHTRSSCLLMAHSQDLPEKNPGISEMAQAICFCVCSKSHKKLLQAGRSEVMLQCASIPSHCS
jgi:hypothetical protein